MMVYSEIYGKLTSSSLSGKNCKAVAQTMARRAVNSRLGGIGPFEKVV